MGKDPSSEVKSPDEMLHITGLAGTVLPVKT